MGPRIVPRGERFLIELREEDRRLTAAARSAVMNSYDETLKDAIHRWAAGAGVEINWAEHDEIYERLFVAVKEVVRDRHWMISQPQIINEWIESCYRRIILHRSLGDQNVSPPTTFRPIDGPGVVVTRPPIGLPPPWWTVPGPRSDSPESMDMHEEADPYAGQVSVVDDDDDEEGDRQRSIRAGNRARLRRTRRRSMSTYRPGQVLRGGLFNVDDQDDDEDEGEESNAESDGMDPAAPALYAVVEDGNMRDEGYRRNRGVSAYETDTSDGGDSPAVDQDGNLPVDFHTEYGIPQSGRPGVGHPNHGNLRLPNDDIFGTSRSRYSSNRVQQYIRSWTDYRYEEYPRRIIRVREAVSRGSMASGVVFQMSEAAARFEDRLGAVLDGETGRGDAEAGPGSRSAGSQVDILQQREEQREEIDSNPAIRQVTGRLNIMQEPEEPESPLTASPVARLMDGMQERSEEFARASGRMRRTGRVEREHELEDRREGSCCSAERSESRECNDGSVERSGSRKIIHAIDDQPEGGRATEATVEAMQADGDSLESEEKDHIASVCSIVDEMASESSDHRTTIDTEIGSPQAETSSARGVRLPEDDDHTHDVRVFPPLVAIGDSTDSAHDLCSLGNRLVGFVKVTMRELHRHVMQTKFGTSYDGRSGDPIPVPEDDRGIAWATHRLMKSVYAEFDRAFEQRASDFSSAVSADLVAMIAALEETNRDFGMNGDRFGGHPSSSRSDSGVDAIADHVQGDKQSGEIGQLPVPRGEKAKLRIDSELVYSNMTTFISGALEYYLREEYKDFVYSSGDVYLDRLQRSTFGMQSAVFVRVLMTYTINMALVAYDGCAQCITQYKEGVDRWREGELSQQIEQAIESTAGSADQVGELRGRLRPLLQAADDETL